VATRDTKKTVLFLAADIASSTQFKDSVEESDGRPGWLEPFEQFFRELPLVLMGQVAQTFVGGSDVPEVGVWRVSGDEVVFLAEPRSAEEARRLVEAFYRTVHQYHARFSEKWPLGLRGCCWAARLPGRNAEIEIPEMATAGGAGGGQYLEYLGPDVDTGFRIAGHADAGHVIISLNLAEALARESDTGQIRFHLFDRRILKGVFAGRPYPLILITLEDAMPDLWQWELEESRQIQVLRDTPPTSPGELVELASRIYGYLNRVADLKLEPLQF
jgi:hypothetical protein